MNHIEIQNPGYGIDHATFQALDVAEGKTLVVSLATPDGIKVMVLDPETTQALTEILAS